MCIYFLVSILWVAQVYGQTTSAVVKYPFEISFSNVTQLKFSAVYYDRFITVTCEHFECDANGLSLTYNFVKEIETSSTTFIDIGFTLSGTSLDTADTIDSKTTSDELSIYRTRIATYSQELPTVISIDKETGSCGDGQTLSFYHDFTVCTQLCSITEKYNSNDHTCTNFNDILYTPAPTMAASVTIVMPDNYVKLCYAYGAGLSAFLTFCFPFCCARAKDCNKARKQYKKKQQKKAKKARQKAKKKATKKTEKEKNNEKNKKSEINTDQFVYNDNDDNEKTNETSNDNDNLNTKDEDDDPSIELDNINIVTKGEESYKDKDDKKKAKDIPKQSILSVTKVVVNSNKKKEEESIEESESDESPTDESTNLKETNQ